jgi:GGDEF domain-containing protein
MSTLDDPSAAEPLGPTDRRRPVLEVLRPRQRRVGGGATGVLILQVEQAGEIHLAHGGRFSDQLHALISGTVRRCLRLEDRLALLRDHDFMIVLRNVSRQALQAICQRVRAAVQALRLSLAGRLWALSCRIGQACATTDWPPGTSLEGLVQEAEAGLREPQARGWVGRPRGP